MNGNLVRRHISGNTYMTTFASEIALIEADKEADRKYRELILEAENILINMQRNQNSSPVVPSPSRRLHNGLANKRVELIKNTELNIELALSKSRNSQPELQSGSIRDLEHTSPKRQLYQPCSPIHRFKDRNTPGLPRENYGSKSSDSPIMQRRTTPQNSPVKSLMYPRPRSCENDNNALDNSASRSMNNCNGIKNGSMVDNVINGHHNYHSVPNRAQHFSPTREDYYASRKNSIVSTRSVKEEGLTSSSSDSEEKYSSDVRRRPPLLTFRYVFDESLIMYVARKNI